MNVNLFFLTIAFGLIGIYVFLRPMVIEKEEKREIALLDLKQFTVYKLEKQGLQSIMTGSSGERYIDRYEVYDTNYTDNSHSYVQHMASDFAFYRGDEVHLEGNVRYEREDGLTFFSNEALYNQKNGIAKTKGSFTVTQNQDKVKGTRLYYNSTNGKIRAKNITGYYTLRNKKDNR